MVTSNHAAADSAVGFDFQGLFALVQLIEAEDDDAVISVETQDDVVLEDTSGRKRFQLKHSLGSPAALSVASDGLWKTIRYWCADADNASTSFVFVTCALLSASSPLVALADGSTQRGDVVAALGAEARRIEKERAARIAAGEKPGFDVKWPGCEAFLALKHSQREALVARVTIVAGNFNATDVPTEVAARLRNYLPAELRTALAERLIEWWQRQVAHALVRKRDPRIAKREVQSKLAELIVDHAPDNLPDHFSLEEPSSLESELGSLMERQIRLVDSGGARLRRAALARWRARCQRAKWMDDDYALAAALKEYDDRLVEHWAEVHGPICDDCNGHAEPSLRAAGLKILDWSHHEAPRTATPIRPKWSKPFFVQGTYQQLADELRVGWHPRFRELLASSPGDAK